MKSVIYKHFNCKPSYDYRVDNRDENAKDVSADGDLLMRTHSPS